MTDFHGDQAKRIFFFEKKIQNGQLKKAKFFKISNSQYFYWDEAKKFFSLKKNPKWPFFKIANSQNFFVKISWIGPWVSRID